MDAASADFSRYLKAKPPRLGRGSLQFRLDPLPARALERCHGGVRRRKNNPSIPHLSMREHCIVPGCELLPDTERGKDPVQNIVGAGGAGDGVDGA